MTRDPLGPANRVREHLERRTRLSHELSRLSADAARLTETDAPAPWWLRLAGGAAASVRAEPGRSAPPVTVAIPVFNAPGELRACLRALSRHTTYPAALLLIDDASTDAQIGELLEMAAGLEGVRVLRNVENLGFTATVNRALRSSEGDVVLLNSDTAVGPRWLEQLVGSAYAEPSIGTVTPVSDNAGAFSVPAIDAGNPLPAALSLSDISRLLGTEGSAQLPEGPTGSGFCLYIKRAVIDDVGEFDAAAFPKGYGEENDFCMRALRHGWRHVVDGRTFVHHEREASFGATKAALSAAARTKLDELHPDYTARVRAFVADPALQAIRDQAAALFARGQRSVRPRLLFVIHDGGGGSIATNLDLMRSLEPEYDCFMFSSDRWTLRLQRITGGALETLHEWPLERAILLGDFSRPDYRAAFARALAVCRPELVHVRHVFKHTLDAPKLAGAAAIPVVMSIHDHYTLCPTIHLLDNTGHYCGGICSPGHGTCQTLVKAGPLPPLKHAFVYQWREEMTAALRHVDTFVTTSPHAREVHQRGLAEIRSARFELIEHGRDLEQASGLADPPVPGGPIRILIPGHLDRHKGAELIAAMRELDVDDRLELHFLGEVPRRWRHLGTMHGAYDREHFLERVGLVRPAFIGIFSVVAETYNHALTEAWAAGIPVLATDLGAQGERIRAHGGGFLLSAEDAAAALAAVLAAADDPERYAGETARATLHDIPSVAQMTERYAHLYREVLDRRRSFAAPASALGEPLARGIWRATAVVPEGSHSGYARVLARLRHPEVEWKLRTRVAAAGEPPELDGAEVLIVHGAALAPELVGGVLDELRRRELPLVLDLDESPGDAETSAALLGAASLVVVSTPELAVELGERCRHLAMHPTGLDERLFLADEAAGRGADADPAAGVGRPLRVLCARSPAGEPLALLRDAVAELALPGGAELEPVAGEAEYPAYAAQLAEGRGRWDIGLAPAGAGELTRLEYAALGLPVVDAERAGWREELGRLAADPAARTALAQAGWAELTAGRLVRQSAEQLLAAIGAARLIVPTLSHEKSS